MDMREHVKALNERGIGAGIHYPIPVHLQPALAHRGWRRGQFPEAEAAAATILSLPLYPELTEAQIDTVVQALRDANEAAQSGLQDPPPAPEQVSEKLRELQTRLEGLRPKRP